jgi:hypothetical protein
VHGCDSKRKRGCGPGGNSGVGLRGMDAGRD